MIMQILKQELIGVIQIAMPILFLFHIYPALFMHSFVQIVCALLVGCYFYYINYTVAQKQIKNLQFAPTGKDKEGLEAIITDCKMDPRKINIRYSYTHGMIATATFNTISLDPIVCSETNSDEQALRAKDIIINQILIHQSEETKQNLEQIRQILTPAAQKFIFKHELGHVFYNYSTKKIVLVSVIGFIMAYFGITTAVYTASALGSVAIVLGIFVASFLDLALSYSSNVWIKAHEEKKADFFAARFSSIEETNAAALFFEKYQEIQDNKTTTGLYAKIPGIILTGHYDGKSRAIYLRKYVQELQSSSMKIKA